MKKIIVFILCLTLLFCFTAPVSALESSSSKGVIVIQRYTCLATASSTLSISGNTATATGIATTHSGSSRITVTSTLQKNVGGVWQNVLGASWFRTLTASSLIVTGSTTISKGTYRVATTYSAYCCGKTESGTVYSVEKTYS